MLKLAITGCSFTNIRQPILTGPNDMYSWVMHASDDMPEIEFHCYANGGQGPWFFDLCLKYFVLKNYKFALLQTSSLNRFTMPLMQQKWYDIRSPWKKQQIKKNLFKYSLPFNMIKTAGENVSVEINDSFIGLKKPILNKAKALRGLTNPSQLAEVSNQLFIDTLEKIYLPLFEKFKYFSFIDHNYNNCNKSENVFKFLEKRYGKRKFLTDYVTDDIHLNIDGSKVAYYNYIKPILMEYLS